LEDN